MKLKKRVKIVLLVLLFLAVTIITFCVVYPERASKNLSELIEKENLDDIRLTIFYLSPLYFTFAPLDVDELVTTYFEQKYVVNSDSLKEHVDLLRRLADAEFEHVEHASNINARIYYVFETKHNQKVFDVAMWGTERSIFVNGIQVKGEDVFYDVLMPFLPADTVDELERDGRLVWKRRAQINQALSNGDTGDGRAHGAQSTQSTREHTGTVPMC